MDVKNPNSSSYFFGGPVWAFLFLEDPNGSSYFLEDPFGSVFFERPKWVRIFWKTHLGLHIFPKYLLKWCKNKDKKERCHLEKTPLPTESVS